MLTQPIPKPSARAASQRFWMAQQTLYTPVSEIVVLPRTKGPNLFGSYVIQMFSEDSKIPSSFSEVYLRCLSWSDSSILTDFWNSSKKDCFILSLISMSLTRIKFHGWDNPTDGAWWAALRILAKMFPGIFLLRNLVRTSLREKIALYTASFSYWTKEFWEVLNTFWSILATTSEIYTVSTGIISISPKWYSKIFWELICRPGIEIQQ